MTILTDDDDPILLTTIQHFLRMWGYETIAAHDGKEAWDRIETDSRINIVILDWHMPHVTGLEVCKRIRRSPDRKHLFVMMLTASRTGKEDFIAALEAGTDDFMMKPFEPPELRARIGNAVRMVTSQLQLREKVSALESALADVKTLKGLLAVCAWCGSKARREDGTWERLDEHIAARTGVELTHAICPDCISQNFAMKR